MLDDKTLRRRIAAVLSAGGLALLPVSCATVDREQRPEPTAQQDDAGTAGEVGTGAADQDEERQRRRYEDMNRPLYAVEETD